MFRVPRAASAFLVATTLLRCGKAPTEPGPTIKSTTINDLAGNWTGAFERGSCRENLQVELDVQTVAGPSGTADQGVQGYFSSVCVSPGNSWVVEVDGTTEAGVLTVVLSAQEQEFAFLRSPVSSTSIDAVSHNSSGPATRLTLSR